MTADRTLIRRYVLALAPAGAGDEAAVTAALVPPLSGGPGSHGGAAAHAFTIADSVGGDLCMIPETEMAAQSQSTGETKFGPPSHNLTVRLHPVQVRMQQRLERAPITLDDRGMRD